MNFLINHEVDRMHMCYTMLDIIDLLIINKKTNTTCHNFFFSIFVQPYKSQIKPKNSGENIKNLARKIPEKEWKKKIYYPETKQSHIIVFFRMQKMNCKVIVFIYVGCAWTNQIGLVRSFHGLYFCYLHS